MAAAVLEGGYDACFLESVDKDLECPVCLLALRDPMQTSCGHLMCKTCMDKITQRDRFQCPLDNKVCSRDEVSLKLRNL
jgi:TNF receptor-associated factor 6